MNDLILISQLVLALVFTVAGVSKLADGASARQAMIDFGVPASLAPAAAVLLPLAELAVAAALLSPGAWYGAAGALALLVAFVAAIGYNLALGRHPDCRCFGQLRSRPVSAATVARNGFLALLAGFVLWPGRDSSRQGLVSRLGDLTRGELTALMLVLLGVLAVIGLFWFLGRMLAQQGRILSRLEALESRLNQVPAAKPATAANGTPQPIGLPVGAPAPAFQLPDLAGKPAALSELLAPGRPLLLLFMDPHCGPCTQLLPELSRWRRENGGRVRFAVISRGKVKENRAKYGEVAADHVLLQENYEVGERYSARGTPSAVLVRADGRIGSQVMIGPEHIKTAVDSILSERTNRNGAAQPQNPIIHPLGEGPPAPEIRLPDLDGHVRRFTPTSGKDTAVLFWNPGCGYCQRMREDLLKWEASDAPGKPELLVVSTGTAESNRAEGFRAPVLLDSGFATAAKFGAGGTPSAVLVDNHGRLASGVAVGAQAVLSLLAPLEVPFPNR